MVIRGKWDQKHAWRAKAPPLGTLSFQTSHSVGPEIPTRGPHCPDPQIVPTELVTPTQMKHDVKRDNKKFEACKTWMCHGTEIACMCIGLKKFCG